MATQFNETLELYNALLRQINSTLAARLNDSGGGAGSGDQQEDNFVSPELLQRLQQYQVMLEQLLERAINATERLDEGDGDSKSDHDMHEF